MGAPAVAETVSFEEFLQAYDGVHAEWVAGSVVETTTPSDRHQDIVGLLGAAFRAFAEERGLGIVRVSPFLMRVGEVAREPDVLFVAEENRERIQPNRLEGPADLVVEVISPESKGRDRGDKFYEYEEAGVREYWLVDPERRSVDLHRLSPSGRYEVVVADGEGRLHSEVLGGLWVDPAWLWREPMPTLISVLKQWGLV